MNCDVETAECVKTYDSQAMIQSLLRGEQDLVYRTALKFAESGLADAQVMMGVLSETGIGVPKNVEDAIRWYERAAAQDHAVAWSNLGTIYLLGLHNGKPDRNKALSCYARAKALG